MQLLSHLLAVTATVRKPRAEGNEQLGAAWRCLALLGARLIRPRPTQPDLQSNEAKTESIKLVCGWETLGSSLAPHLIGNMNTHYLLSSLLTTG